MNRTIMVLAGAAIGALAGCGGTMTADPLGTAYNADRQSLIDMENRLSARSPTTAANMPTSGAATYEGYTGIVLEGPVLDLSLVGDATVTADFGRGVVSGRATDFIGTEGGFSAEDYDGSLVLSGGRIGNPGASDATGRLTGTLTGTEHEVVVDAQMQGRFVGNPSASGVTFYSASGSALLDGRPTTGAIGIVAER